MDNSIQALNKPLAFIGPPLFSFDVLFKCGNKINEKYKLHSQTLKIMSTIFYYDRLILKKTDNHHGITEYAPLLIQWTVYGNFLHYTGQTQNLQPNSPLIIRIIGIMKGV